jgi:hypothetical protein
MTPLLYIILNVLAAILIFFSGMVVAYYKENKRLIRKIKRDHRRLFNKNLKLDGKVSDLIISGSLRSKGMNKNIHDHENRLRQIEKIK